MAEETNNTINKAISDLSRRIKVLEERYSIIRRKEQIADQNLIETEKELKTALRRLSNEVTEVRRLINDIDDKLDRFLEQVKKGASKEEVLIIKKYLEMWDPINFLTYEEAKRLLKEHLEQTNQLIKK